MVKNERDSTVRAVNEKLGNIKLISANIDSMINTLQNIKDRFPQYESLLLRLPSGVKEVTLELRGLRNETGSERKTRKHDKDSS